MKQTTEARAEARFSHEKPYPDQFSAKYGYATCIREEVEPREAEVVAKNAEIEQLRVLVQELVNACHCSGHAGMQTGAQASAIRTAKQAGFVPTNTEDNG